MTLPVRYLRNRAALSEAECAVLAEKTVLVAGCGGLGGYVIESLARIGVGRIIALDCDAFDESNLNRQLLATEATIGTSKAQAAAERVAAVNPLVRVEARIERLGEESARALAANVDCAIDALDDLHARFWLAHACQEEDTPLVYGAVAGWYGQVCTVMPGDSSFVTVYGTAEGSGIEKTEGVLPFTAAATAAFQSAEAVKVLLNRGGLIRGRLLMIDALSGVCDDMPLEG